MRSLAYTAGMASPQEALQLAERITQLRAELKTCEERFYAMFPGDAARPGAPDMPAVTGANPPVAVRIRQLMREFPGRDFRAADFRRLMPGTNIKLIRSTLFRLKKEAGFSTAGGAYRYNGPTAVTQAIKSLSSMA